MNRFWRCGCGARRKKFSHRLSELVELRDEQGGALPFTYGLFSRAARYAGLQRRWVPPAGAFAGPQGYFRLAAPQGGTRFLRATRFALDNDQGGLALAKGEEADVIGALSPAYPAVRRMFLQHVRGRGRRGGRRGLARG